ncbi:MAG: DNA-binding domain-containing protein [gamma proteobacterium symbiont of Ctena orbiculata]
MLGLRRKAKPPHPDCLPVLLPLDLIGQRSKQIKTIQQLAGVPKTHWKSLYLDALLSFAGYVQQLPASEAHHHPGAGGLLDHSLEVVIKALQIRRGHLLPQGADAEEVTAKKDLWTYAIFSSALLHDIGKPLMDQVVTLYSKDGHDLGTWNALTAPMTGEGWYRIRYRKDRQHKLHERAALLVSRLILPVPALTWLSSDRVLLSTWLAAISGVYEDAGVIGEITQRADNQSVADNLGASDVTTQLPGARSPLHERLLTGLRYLLKENQIPLNRNGAAAWLDDERLWLVSKRGIDALREHLLQEGHTGIPTRNDRIFDELQQHNVLTPNGDRSIWKVEITGEDWSHTLTCLCFPASRIWPDPDSRPNVFNGSITPVVSGIEDESSTDTTPQPVKENIATIPIEQPTPDKQDSVTGSFDPVAFFSASQPEETAHKAESIDNELIEDKDDPGQLFQAWLQDGLRKDKFETNSVNARIHRVEEGLLLVSPGIFKDYDKEDWQRVQKRFQKLKLHRKTPQGTNIYTYQVTGKRNKSRIKGFLIEEPETVFSGISLPTPNPHLKLAEEL